MSTSTEAPLIAECPCGARAKVPARYAGRKIRCKGCARGLRVPGARVSEGAKLGTSPTPQLLAEEKRTSKPARARAPRCVGCQTRIGPGVQRCMRCGCDQVTGASPRVAARVADRPTTELVLPASLFAAGFLAQLVIFVVAGIPALAALGALTLRTVVWLVLAVVSCVVVGSGLFNTNFGEVKSAVLKLGAVGTVPGALGLLLALALGGLGGAFLGMLLVFALYYFLLMRLFDMGFTEALVFSVVVWLLDKGVALALTAAAA